MTREERRTEHIAKEAAKRIIRELLDRHQFEWWWEPIDSETKKEILWDIRNAVSVAISDAMKGEYGI